MTTTWEQRQKTEQPRYTVHVNVLETVGGGDSKQTRKIIEFSLTGTDLDAVINKGTNVLELSRPELSEAVTDGAGNVVKRVAR
jgi:hypothetical protein